MRIGNTTSRADVQMVNQSMDTGTRGGVFVMRPNATGTGNYDKLIKMTLDATGAWGAAVASIPVHANT